MPDAFSRHASSLIAPAAEAEAITPSDSASLSHVTRAIYVGGTGNLRLRMASGTVVTLSAVQTGVVYPLRASQVMATGTTATGLVGLS